MKRPIATGMRQAHLMVVAVILQVVLRLRGPLIVIKKTYPRQATNVKSKNRKKKVILNRHPMKVANLMKMIVQVAMKIPTMKANGWTKKVEMGFQRRINRRIELILIF